MELSAYFRPLRRWWWLLLASALLAAASSYLSVSQQPPLYVARTTLMIGRAFEDPNPTGSELALGQQLAETYADLVQRRPVREQTMAALGLTSLPGYSARTLPNRQLLEISVVDTSPQRAKAVANELANQLVLQSPTSPRPEEQEREAFINDQLATLEVRIRQTEEEITAKQSELESAFGALEISELQAEIAALQTKLGTLQSNYAVLLANTKGGAVNTIQVIEPATLPSAPTASGKWQLVLVASAIAVALAAGTAYVLEYLDNTVRTAEDLARVNSFASLPSIPEFRWDGSILPVLAQDAPRSPVTDAFRALRTGLYAATANKPGKIFLITSAAPQEGKSMVAANLAAVMAQGDKSVLLIDADLRRPVQHKLFSLSWAYGLAELLSAPEGHGSPNGRGEMIKRVIQMIEPMRLGLIVAGSDLADAPGLLGSDRMRVLLETVSRDVDYVIIDSPPVLAVADALMLSTQVDGVVVVASAGLILRKQLEQTLRRLSDVNANVLGVVLNRQKAATNGYYAYYHRAYTNQS
ncbi:MAG: polysaccharide biosynthesis tyrosine autokinase [Chloroflexi bacterium]|nr:polysaccharide biosynthesis tyrosine autokinase [Chloroflexota bacterium]